MARIVVIGGGIVGISCALSLLDDGHRVTVIEPGPVGEGASWASCGCIAGGEIVPLSQPGLLRKVPGWLIDPEAPLSLRPSTALRLMPWFLRFAANARASRMRAIAADLAPLALGATADFRAQIGRYGMGDMLIDRPVLKLFDDAGDRATMGAAFDLAREMGCRIDEISGAEAHDTEPAIAGDFQYAAVLRDWSHVADPKALVIGLMRAFEAGGGAVVRARAKGLSMAMGRVTAVRCDDGQAIDGDEFILSAGLMSAGLARDVGLRLPLTGIMGYSTALSDPGVALKHTVFYPKGGFGMTPYRDALAVAGTIEFAGPEAPPRWRRADVLVKRAHRVLPGLQDKPASRRMGRRPFTPDTRPLIGRTKRAENLILATGHGQLGLTLGATTGGMVADLVAGRVPAHDPGPFSPDRFG